MYHVIEEHPNGRKVNLLSNLTFDECSKAISYLDKKRRDLNYVGFRDTSRYAVIGWFIYQ